MGADLMKHTAALVPGEWSYSGSPEYQSRSQYDRVRERYVGRCRRLPGVQGVWTVGAVSVPGISDIDFVVALTDPMPEGDLKSLSIHSLESAGSYLLLHQPLVLSEPLIKDLFLWGSVSTPQCLWGDPQQVQPLSAEQARLMALVTLNDVFVQTQPLLLLRTLLSHQLHIRGTLCQINALKHMLRLYHEATGQPTGRWDDFVVEFAQFRSEWFSLGPNRLDRLKAYVAEAVALVFDMMDAYSHALVDQSWYQPGTSSWVHFITPGLRVRFVRQWDKLSALSHVVSESKRSGSLSLHMPLAFAEPLRSYVSGDGPLTDHVRRSLWPRNGLASPAWDGELSALAARHVATRNAHVAFLLHNRLLWDDANFSSLGLWPRLLTDHSLRGRLRRWYYRARRWREKFRLLLSVGEGPRGI